MNSAALCSPAANFLQTLILLLKSTEHALGTCHLNQPPCYVKSLWAWLGLLLHKGNIVSSNSTGGFLLFCQGQLCTTHGMFVLPFLSGRNCATYCWLNLDRQLMYLHQDSFHCAERKEDSQETFWHTMFLRPVLQSMQRGGSSLRSSIAIHVLPGVFKVDRSSINFMLRIQVQDLQFPTTKHTSYTDQVNFQWGPPGCNSLWGLAY